MAPHQTRTLQLLLIAFGFSFVVVGGIRPLFGYSDWVSAAGLVVAATITLATMRSEGLTLRALGGSRQHLFRALAVTAAALALTLLLGLGLRAAGLLSGPLLMAPATPGELAYLSVEAFSEELLFRGFLLTGLARLLDAGPFPWRAWLLSSLLCALYHLPTLLWSGGRADAILLSIALPLVASLLLLGPLYLLSRNLWLTMLVHGSIGLLFSPLIAEEPLIPLAFTATILALGRFLLLPEQLLPLTNRSLAARLHRDQRETPRRIWHVI